MIWLLLFSITSGRMPYDSSFETVDTITVFEVTVHQPVHWGQSSKTRRWAFVRRRCYWFGTPTIECIRLNSIPESTRKGVYNRIVLTRSETLEIIRLKTRRIRYVSKSIRANAE
jgi:hypothetical protein